MAIKDNTWAIVDMNTRGKPIFLNYTCSRTRKICIDLHRVNNINNNVILKRAGISKGELPSEIQRYAVVYSLQKILTWRFYDIKSATTI